MSDTARTTRALLLIACSARKNEDLHSGRAWNLYDGQLFRVLKKALGSHPGWRQDVEVLIVSARYGVIRPGRVIETYNERLNRTLRTERGNFWAQSLRRVVVGRSFRAVHVNLGRDYLAALPPLVDLFPGLTLDYARGGIGSRNSQTRRWVLDQLERTPKRSSGLDRRRGAP